MPICLLNTARGVIRDCWHLQDERKERKGAQRGKEGIGAEHQYGQTTCSSQGGSFPHSSKNPSQGGTITSREKSAYGRMSLFLSYVTISNIFVVIIFSHSFNCHNSCARQCAVVHPCLSYTSMAVMLTFFWECFSLNTDTYERFSWIISYYCFYLYFCISLAYILLKRVLIITS